MPVAPSTAAVVRMVIRKVRNICPPRICPQFFVFFSISMHLALSPLLPTPLRVSPRGQTKLQLKAMGFSKSAKSQMPIIYHIYPQFSTKILFWGKLSHIYRKMQFFRCKWGEKPPIMAILPPLSPLRGLVPLRIKPCRLSPPRHLFLPAF